MLAAAGILSRDLAAIERGSRADRREIDAGTFEWSLDAEDVHLNIERRLTALVGDAGKRLHTARSRNDQVATDLRLWLRDEIDEIRGSCSRRCSARCSTRPSGMPPHHAGLHAPAGGAAGDLRPSPARLRRDARARRGAAGRLRARGVNRLPLGAAALAGTSFPIDRERVARELGFEALCENSLDAVSDRDFAIEFCACAALVMVHLSRFAEELVLWMSPRFGFVRLPDRFCTGSSIMPQKKNPDVPGAGARQDRRVIGATVALLTLMKGQPLAYNKDNQEDKEPLFDAVDTLKDTLACSPALVGGA